MKTNKFILFDIMLATAAHCMLGACALMTRDHRRDKANSGIIPPW